MFARCAGEAIQAATIACGVASCQRAPGDVLADFVADARAVDVAAGAHPAERRVAARADVFEVVVGRHALGVALGGVLELCRWACSGRSPCASAFAIDQAERRFADRTSWLRWVSGRVLAFAAADAEGRAGGCEPRSGSRVACGVPSRGRCPRCRGSACGRRSWRPGGTWPWRASLMAQPWRAGAPAAGGLRMRACDPRVARSVRQRTPGRSAGTCKRHLSGGRVTRSAALGTSRSVAPAAHRLDA